MIQLRSTRQFMVWTVSLIGGRDVHKTGVASASLNKNQARYLYGYGSNMLKNGYISVYTCIIIYRQKVLVLPTRTHMCGVQGLSCLH